MYAILCCNRVSFREPTTISWKLKLYQLSCSILQFPLMTWRWGHNEWDGVFDDVIMKRVKLVKFYWHANNYFQVRGSFHCFFLHWSSKCREIFLSDSFYVIQKVVLAFTSILSTPESIFREKAPNIFIKRSNECQNTCGSDQSGFHEKNCRCLGIFSTLKP